MSDDAIALVRRFNRAVTLAAGALDTSFLGRGRPLAVARVLRAIGEERDVAEVREELRLDSGFLSRILRRLEREGMISLARSPADARRRIARATPEGLEEIAAYDRLGEARAAAMLLPEGPRRTDLLAAMDLVATVLSRDRIRIVECDPDAPEARACLAAYSDVLAQRVPGLGRSHVPLPDPDAASYRPPGGVFLLATVEGRALGCVSLKTVAPGTGEVKRLWIAPVARGLGLARRMMQEVEARARSLGLLRLRLDTSENLPEAIALYRSAGWTDAEPFSAFPATHWFAKAL